MKLEFSPQIFEKYSGIGLYENPSSRSWVVQCGRMDRRKGPDSRFTKFRERV